MKKVKTPKKIVYVGRRYSKLTDSKNKKICYTYADLEKLWDARYIFTKKLCSYESIGTIITVMIDEDRPRLYFWSVQN